MTLVPAFEIGVWNAWIFMSVFIIQMLVMFSLGKAAWRRSSAPAAVERNGTEKQAGLLGNTVWAVATFYSIFLPLKLGTPWFYIGFPVYYLGVMLLAVATADSATTPPDQPITRGTYAFSRHPMYLASFLIYIGIGIATASWLFLLLALANIFWVNIEARVEERYCLARYGDLYRDYLKQAPRWLGIPRKG